MDIVKVEFSTSVEVVIPSEIELYEYDNKLTLKATSIGDVADWLREVLDEVDSYL